MYKRSCVIAISDIDGKKFMFKNRDRNYTPQLKIYHTIRNGVEMVYFRDEHTGWVEGINEHGIGVANSALMVLWDEKEGKKGKKKDHATLGIVGSRDAGRILKTLESTNIEDALDRVIHYDGGVRGHTFLSDGNVAKSIEHTARHEAFISDLATGGVHVRSNHGDHYPDAGYTIGENKESSHTRLKKVLEAISEGCGSPEDLIKKLYAQRFEDPSSPFNVVRKTDNMYTSSQLIYDFENRKISLYLVPEDCEYLGYVKDFERQGNCSFEVYRLGHFNDDGSFNLKKVKGNPVRVASRAKQAMTKEKAEKKYVEPILVKKIKRLFDTKDFSNKDVKYIDDQFKESRTPLMDRDESIFIEWQQIVEEDIPIREWRSEEILPDFDIDYEVDSISLVGDVEWVNQKGGVYIQGKALVIGRWNTNDVNFIDPFDYVRVVDTDFEIPLDPYFSTYEEGWEKTWRHFYRNRTVPNGSSKREKQITRGWEGVYNFSKVIDFQFPVFEDKFLDIQYQIHVGAIDLGSRTSRPRRK